MTMIQVEAILTAICAEDCLVKKLDISYINLSSVDPGLLARAVNMLEEVEMVQREKDAIKQREHENKKVRSRVPRCPFTHFSNQFVCDW